jgi:hypothetical protein
MSSSSCSRRPPCSDTPAGSPALYAAAAASHMSPASFVSTCSAWGLPSVEPSCQNPGLTCSAAEHDDQPCAGDASQRWLALQLSGAQLGRHLAADVREVVQVGGLASQRVGAREQLAPGTRHRRRVVPAPLGPQHGRIPHLRCSMVHADGHVVRVCRCEVSRAGQHSRTIGAGAGPTVRPPPSPTLAGIQGCRTPVNKSSVGPDAAAAASALLSWSSNSAFAALGTAGAHVIDGAVEAAVHCGGQRLPSIHDSWRSGGAIAPLRILLHPVLQLRRAMPTKCNLSMSEVRPLQGWQAVRAITVHKCGNEVVSFD